MGYRHSSRETKYVVLFSDEGKFDAYNDLTMLT